MTKKADENAASREPFEDLGEMLDDTVTAYLMGIGVAYYRKQYPRTDRVGKGWCELATALATTRMNRVPNFLSGVSEAGKAQS